MSKSSLSGGLTDFNAFNSPGTGGAASVFNFFVGLADRLIDESRREAVIDDLLRADWRKPASAVGQVLREHAGASRARCAPTSR